MFGKATLEIPESNGIGRSVTNGLSDTLALGYGRIAAITLSDKEALVVVTLSNGKIVTFGYQPYGGI